MIASSDEPQISADGLEALEKGFYSKTRDPNVFALLLDTVSKVANFLPSSIADPSFRYVTKSTNLYPPYWTIDLWDVLAEPIDVHSLLAEHSSE